MAGLNKVLLIGNTTRDTELRKTDSGKSVANMRLATNRRVHGSEQTLYHTVICWDGLAETVARFAKKGRQVYVEGRLEHRMFTDEEGRERGTVEIVALTFHVLQGAMLEPDFARFLGDFDVFGKPGERSHGEDPSPGEHTPGLGLR